MNFPTIQKIEYKSIQKIELPTFMPDACTPLNDILYRYILKKDSSSPSDQKVFNFCYKSIQKSIKSENYENIIVKKDILDFCIKNSELNKLYLMITCINQYRKAYPVTEIIDMICDILNFHANIIICHGNFSRTNGPPIDPMVGLSIVEHPPCIMCGEYVEKNSNCVNKYMILWCSIIKDNDTNKDVMLPLCDFCFDENKRWIKTGKCSILFKNIKMYNLATINDCWRMDD